MLNIHRTGLIYSVAHGLKNHMHLQVKNHYAEWDNPKLVLSDVGEPCQGWDGVSLQKGDHQDKEAEEGASRDDRERRPQVGRGGGELLANNTAHGFPIAVSPEIIDKIRGAVVQPLGLATQYGLTKDGSRKDKQWLTQDLSSSYSLMEEDICVTPQIDIDQYPEMFYGWFISCVIHFIVNLPLAHPATSISSSQSTATAMPIEECLTQQRQRRTPSQSY